MSTNNTVRLNKILRELNISLDEAINLFSKLGFDIEARPTAKIDINLYELLKIELKYITPVKPVFFNEKLITTPTVVSQLRKEYGVPENIFKYYSLNEYNFESIRDKYLYFPRPSDFNDPFDCNSELISFINENSKLKTNHKKIKKNFVDKFENTGVCCFSRSKESILMWSHYATKHQGFCIEFRANKNIDGINPLDVNYVSEFRKAEYFEKAERAIFHLLFTKSDEWKYEQELRIALTNIQSEEDRKVPYKDNDLLSIYFGVNCQEETINRVLKLIRNNYSSQINFYVGETLKNNYGINWKKIK